MLTGKNRQDSFRTDSQAGRPEKFFVASCISVLFFWLLRIRSWYFRDRTLCSRSLPLFMAETVVEAHRCYFARAKYSRLTHEALAMPKVLDLTFNTR